MTAPTDADRAREIAGICENSAVAANCYSSQRQCAACMSTRLIASALAAVRAEERERAARIVDTLIVPGADGVHTVTRDAIADAIRRQEG